MKVSELIEKLKEFDPEAPVVVMEEIIYEGASKAFVSGVKVTDFYPTPRIESLTSAVFIYAVGDEDE